MNRDEATRRANASRDYQKMLSWHLEHNGDMIERARGAAAEEGHALRVYLLQSGSIALEVVTSSDDLQFSGDIIWHPTVVGEVPIDD